jgi:biopolymer transport protein ExbB
MAMWIVIVEWLARLILLVLILLSVWSIAIILDRKKFFKNLDEDSEFEKIKSEASKFNLEKIEMGISRYIYDQQVIMLKGLGVLGTLGSTTPFIGLLGTILGIIVAFGELSQGTSGTNAIMFALAEALILTAVGLFVAIPAVIAFNFFNKKIKDIKNGQQARLNEFLAKENT